ncbi:MAG TPA: Uma2 family endonuclease [Thermoanaerobaculia bacterium]|nr:Uma2 family endonuclease [Thermoanaerobaculia bacterium]
MAIPFQREVYYPESDGKPMGETEYHRDEIHGLIWVLQQRYRDVPDVHVTGNLFFYYVEGDPRFVVCPDVFVVKGISKHQRRIYKLWEEGQAPCLVIEVTSDNTWEEDLKGKKDLYERLGVEEYLLHDPMNDCLRPPLQGFRLEAGRYRRLEPAANGSLVSRTTGVTFRPLDRGLRLIDTATGQPLPDPNEVRLELDRERERRLEAEERALAAEEELSRLRRELERRS